MSITEYLIFFFHFIQGSHIKIRTNSELPVQVDGEPWIQPPGDIVVLRSALKVGNLNIYFDFILARLRYGTANVSS